MKRKRYNQPVHKKWVDPATKCYDDHLKAAHERGEVETSIFKEFYKKPKGTTNLARMVNCSMRNRPPKDFY